MQDVNRIWDNAILYNGSNSEVGKLALELRKSSHAQLQKYGLSSTGSGVHNTQQCLICNNGAEPSVDSKGNLLAEAVATESAQRNRRLTAGHAPTRWEPTIAEPSESKRSRSRSQHKPAEPVLIHQVCSETNSLLGHGQHSMDAEQSAPSYASNRICLYLCFWDSGVET